MSPLTLVLLSAVFWGLWATFEKLAGQNANSAFAAFLTGLSAACVGLLFFAVKGLPVPLFTHWKGIAFAALTGLSAFILEVFLFRAYAGGMTQQVAIPILIGGGATLAMLIGVVALGEPLTLRNVIGGILALGGVLVLTTGA